MQAGVFEQKVGGLDAYSSGADTDWRARKARAKEKAPADIVQPVLDYVGVLLKD